MAEWLKQEENFSLHVHCYLSGGIVIGMAGWRDSIFRREFPIVLKYMCDGDKGLFDANPSLRNANILFILDLRRKNSVKWKLGENHKIILSNPKGSQR